MTPLGSEEPAGENQTRVKTRLEVIREPSTCHATPRSRTAGVRTTSDLRGSRRRASCAPHDPEGPLGEPPARVVASREPSVIVRPASEPRRTHRQTIRAKTNSRGTHQRTSKPRPQPEGHISDSSARVRAPGTIRRSSGSRPSPEGLINGPSERVHAPRDPSRSFRTTSAPRRARQRTIDPRPGLRDLSQGVSLISEIRGSPRRTISPLQAPPEPVGIHPAHPVTPKGSRAARQRTSRLRGAHQHQSSASL